MKITIPDAINQMLRIVDRLRSAYPKKRFTIDGRLVGDLGERLVADVVYDLQLFENLKKHHDGSTTDGKQVQIKATMKNSLTFPVDHIPEYYLGIQIHQDGKFSEIFNGPERIAQETVKGRKPTETNLHSITIGALKKLNEKVKPSERIPIAANYFVVSSSWRWPIQTILLLTLTNSFMTMAGPIEINLGNHYSSASVFLIFKEW